MQLLKKNGILLFWLVLFADCYLIFKGLNEYHAYLKISLIPILAFYIFLNARKKHYIRSKTLVFLGLLFFWIGDIILLKDDTNYLIAGAVALVGGYIFYSIFLYRIQKINTTESYEIVIIAALVLVLLNYQFFKFLKDDLETISLQKKLMIAYSFVISATAILAANIYSNKGKRNMALQFFIPAIILLLISNAVIVVFKYKYTDESFLKVIIMLTYGYGQCLFAQGFTKYLKG